VTSAGRAPWLRCGLIAVRVRSLVVVRLDTGSAFVVFDEQDSGCLSYGVEAAGIRWFVKSATTTGAESSLRNALRLHSVVRHDAIVRPIVAFTLDGRMALVYPWAEGSVLNHATIRGSDRSALGRFQALPVAEVRAAIDTVLRPTSRSPRRASWRWTYTTGASCMTSTDTE
jgi:hypothetical protein